MKKLGVSITDGIHSMQKHWEAFDAAMSAYRAACETANWSVAEEKRQNAVANLELFMDAFAAAHRRIEAEPR